MSGNWINMDKNNNLCLFLGSTGDDILPVSKTMYIFHIYDLFNQKYFF